MIYKIATEYATRGTWTTLPREGTAREIGIALALELNKLGRRDGHSADVIGISLDVRES